MKNCGIKSEILLDQKLITKENVMNNKFDSDDDLPLKEKLELCNMVMVVRWQQILFTSSF